MALRFTLNGSQRVDYGTAVGLFPDTCLIGAWIYPTTLDSTYQVVLEKTPSGYSDYRGLGINASTGTISAFMRRGAPFDTGIDMQSAAVLIANRWQFIAAQLDAASAEDLEQQIYYGLERNPAAEVSYLSQTAGTGSTTPVATPLTVGNNIGGGAEGFPGLIQYPFVIEGRPSLKEIVDFQFNPRIVPGLKFLSILGRPGVQPVLAGGTHGTVTGAVMAKGEPPILPLSRPAKRYSFASVSGGGGPAKRDGMFFGVM
ncbi:MAG: hypothetical protein IT174_10775 [Acidobacteria bacterium]|nr:hypothetical protein [Acidobacteriota bacterium]